MTGSHAAPTTTPPGPPPRRGVLATLRFFRAFSKDPIAFVGRRFETYGDIYYAPSGGTPLYVVKHPDFAWQVLVRDAAKYDKQHSAFHRLREVLGNGLVTAEGEDWRRHRRMIQPAFGKQALRSYLATMAEEVADTLERWHPRQVRDIDEEMTGLTLRIVTRALFGFDSGAEATRVNHTMEIFRDVVGVPDLLPAWLPNPQRWRTKAATEALDAIILRIIAERRARPLAPDARPDLLEMLLAARDEEGGGATMSDAQIRDELITMFVAGHETTARALTWTLYLLGHHPEVEARLVEELDRVLAGRPPSGDDLDDLVYTRQVFEEAMRVRPPVTTITRRAAVDTTLGDYPVPAGSEVAIWIWHVHRHPEVWPEPEVFNPDNMAAGATAGRPRCAYMPFGAGPRACIGKTFATLEGQLLLASMLQRFRFELTDRAPNPPRLGITISPSRPVKLHLVARSRR